MKHRPFGRRVLVAVACAFIVPALISPVAGAATVSEASELLAAGRLVEAKRVLIALDRDALGEADRERAFELMAAVDRRLRHADPVDISLQKAELALRIGDLREADRQAHAARRADAATREQQQTAADLLERSAQTKLELEPLVGPALAQAVADFDAGRYAEAKSGFDSVYRSGARLSPADLRTIDRHRDRIADLEQKRGGAFGFDRVPLGMLQPGSVTRRDDPTRAEPRNEQAPNQQPPTGEPVPAQPFQPEGQRPVRPQQPGREGDVFQEGLRFDAQRLLSEADRAFADGHYSTALERYQEVAGPYRAFVTPEEAGRADNRIAEIRVLLERSGAGLEDLIQEREFVAEQTRAEFDNFLNEARAALSTGDTERARNLAQQARLRLTDARQLFSEAEFNDRIARQQALLQEIVAAEERIRTEQIAERERGIAAEAQRQEAARQQERRRKINESLDRVRALQLEQKYDEALQVVDQILFLDPQDPAGLLLRDTLQDVRIYHHWDRQQRINSLSHAEEFNRIQDAKFLPGNLLDYPPDWPEISFRRGEPSAYSESPADRRVLAELDSRRIPASFTDNTLEDVLAFVATVTNLNVDVDWDSLSTIGVDRTTLVSLNLQPLPARVVLDRVLQKVSPDTFSRAGWAVNDGVLVVASEQDLRKNTFIVIYDVRDLLFQIPSFDDFPSLDLDSVLNQREGGGTGSIFQDTDQDDATRLSKEELKERLIDIIQTNVDFEGWRDNGGDTGIIQELNDNLIITNTARNHRAISGLLRQLREIRSIQINVEARFLVVTQEFFEQIGFDVDIIFNAMNSQFEDAVFQQTNLWPTLTQTGPSGNTSLRPNDLVAPYFLGGNNRSSSTSEFVVTSDPDAEFTEVEIGPAPFVVTRPERTSIIPAQQNSRNITEGLISSAFAAEVLAFNPALAIAGTFLDDVQVDFLIEATQADRRNVVLTAPRLTFTNGHAANIFVTTQTAFVSDLNPIVGTNSVAFDPTVSVVSEGFTLGLEGVVSADRRYVTLTVRTQLAEVVTFASATVTAQTGGGTQGGVPSEPAEASFQLPIVQTTSLSTGATIPDRGTLLVGGQRLSTEVEVETGVPVLSKIPILNRFFSNRIESREEQTLLILLKPTIIIQNEEEEKNFPGLLDSLRNRFDSGF